MMKTLTKQLDDAARTIYGLPDREPEKRAN